MNNSFLRPYHCFKVIDLLTVSVNAQLSCTYIQYGSLQKAVLGEDNNQAIGQKIFTGFTLHLNATALL